MAAMTWRRLGAWLALVAVLAHTGTHLLSYAAGPAQSALFGVLCSADGVKKIVLLEGGQPGKPAGTQPEHDHCAFCFNHAQGALLPALAAVWLLEEQPSPAAERLPAAPVLPERYASQLPRGPPPRT
jgi:hypothetical protein